MNKTKINKILSILLKISVLFFSLLYIGYKIFFNPDLSDIKKSVFIATVSDSFIWYFLLAVILMPMNWWLETVKWRFLIRKIGKLSYYESLKAVLVGITFSSFTPNRIGDYFGRTFMLKNADRGKGFLITIVGSIAQTIITIIAGSISIFFLRDILLSNNDSITFLFFMYLILFIICISLLLFYFKISLLHLLLKWIRVFKRLTVYFEILTEYTFSELLKVLMYSFLRYWVFSIQFYLLLLMFNVTIPFFEGLAMIAVIYFITTIVPSIAVTEIGVKSAAAIYFIELYFIHNNMIIDNLAINLVAATFLLWILNLVIPALAGFYYVIKMKPFLNTSVNDIS